MSAAADTLAEGRTRLRVRYPETDRMGVVHHSHYWVWFELGRTELLREAGLSYRELEDAHGLFFPVIRLAGHYRAPARYDDLLTVRTQLTAVGRARMRFDYELYDERDGRLLATGFTEHAATGRDGRPRAIPADLRALWEPGRRRP